MTGKKQKEPEEDVVYEIAPDLAGDTDVIYEILAPSPNSEEKTIAEINDIFSNPNFNKHLSIIHHKGELDANPLKLLNILYKVGAEYSFEKETYYITKSVIQNALGWAHGSYANLFEAFRRLRRTPLTYNKMGTDKKNEAEWENIGETSFISAFNIKRDDDIITFGIPEPIRRLLAKPNIYAPINIERQKLLRSKYEVLWYEFGRGELFRTKNQRIVTRWYSITDIRLLLNINESEYLGRNFAEKCIRTPIRNITSKTDISIEIIDVTTRTWRGGGKICAYKFAIEFKSFTEETKAAMDNFEASPQPSFTKSNNRAEKELLNFFNEVIAKKIIKSVEKKYPDSKQDWNSYIIDNINYAKSHDEKNSITNLPGYIIKAIELDYANYFGDKKTAKAEREEERRLKQRRTDDTTGVESMQSILDRFNTTMPKTMGEIIAAFVVNKDLFNQKRDFFEKLSKIEQDTLKKRVIAQLPSIYQNSRLDDPYLTFQAITHYIDDDLNISHTYITNPTL